MLCEATGEAATIVAASADHKEAAGRLADAIERIAGERIKITTNLMMAFFSGAKKFVLLATPAEILKIAAFIKESRTRQRIETLATTPLGKDACAFQTIDVKDFRVLLAIGMTPTEVDFAATEILATMTLDEYEDLTVTVDEVLLRPRVAVRGLALSERSVSSFSAGELRALRLSHVVAPPGVLLQEARAMGLKTYLRAGAGVDLTDAENCDGIAALFADEVTLGDFEQSLATFAADNPGCELLLPADEAFDPLAERAQSTLFFNCRRLTPQDTPRQSAWPILTQSDGGGLTGALLRHDGNAFLATADEGLSPIESAALQIVPWRTGDAAAGALSTALAHAGDDSTRDAVAQLLGAIADADGERLRHAARQLRERTASRDEDRPEGLLEILCWSDTMDFGA